MEIKDTIKNKAHKKLLEIRKDIEKVEKDKAGYNFKYENPAEIAKAVNDQLIKKNINHNMSLRIRKNEFEPESVTRKEIYGKTKSGHDKTEYMTSLIIEHIYTDIESGDEITYIGIGSGVADQPGQADGAAWSYSRRQEYEKRFAITIEKTFNDEFEVDLKYVSDKDGNSTRIIDENTFRKITSTIQAHKQPKSQEEFAEYVASYVDKLNAKLGTSYKKLKLIPKEYAETIVEIISMDVNA